MTSKKTPSKPSPPHKTPSKTSPPKNEPKPTSALRLWSFRLAAVLLVPLWFLAGLELALRVGGFGHPTDFLIPADEDGVRVTNPRFGYRFFPPALARAPVPFELDGTPEAGTLRVFVVGGSAAMGTPDSAFGLARILGEMLSAAWPERRVEVRNAAMTAISSHVVLPIVRELADYDPDLVVIYLGNNEVVGPFGAATVFGPVAPSRWMVRASVAARSTRVGQLVDRLVGGDDMGDDVHAEWRGMEMFQQQQIAADDPRLERVYASFEANLADIVSAARDARAAVVLSTVAVNLRDQAPFASLHRPGLTEEEFASWRAHRDAGLDSLRSGDYLAALDGLEAAAEIDDGHAELHFLLGHTLLGLDDAAGARRELERARDLDALRFRADSRINETIRDVARGRGAALVDAAEIFAVGEGLPGRRLFHEHVHLNVPGHQRLASAIYRAALDQLPGASEARPASSPAGPEALGLADLAQRLPVTAFDVHEMELEIYSLVARPPFVDTFGHGDDLSLRRRRLEALRLGLDADEWRRAGQQYEARLRSHPDDFDARRRFATLLGRWGEPRAAAEQWRILVDRMPGVRSWRSALASELVAAGRIDEALAEQQRLLEQWPEHEAGVRVNLGAMLQAADRRDEAERQYELAMEADPDDPRAAYNLAALAADRGETDEAVRRFRQLLEDHPHFAPAHHNLGVAMEKQGDLAAAAEHYRDAIEAQPDRAQSHVALGLVHESLGETDEAYASYRRALESAPEDANAYFRLGDLLLAHGRVAEAVVVYRGGLRLAPQNETARRNLETAVGAAEAAKEERQPPRE